LDMLDASSGSLEPTWVANGTDKDVAAGSVGPEVVELIRLDRVVA
jgi:hypothetical protein